MWLLAVWRSLLVMVRWQQPLCSFWRKFPASLLLLQPGRSFIRWCIRWQSQLRALCSSVGLTFQTLHFLYFSILVDHQGSWSTILQNWETLWGTDPGLNSCLTDKMLKRSTPGGLSSHFLGAEHPGQRTRTSWSLGVRCLFPVPGSQASFHW